MNSMIKDGKILKISILLLFMICFTSGCFQQSPTKAILPSFPDTIKHQDSVWTFNKPVTSESETHILFDESIMNFWNLSIEKYRSHGLYYPGNYTPLVEQEGITQMNLTIKINNQSFGPTNWCIVVPAITKNALWRIGSDGYIEENINSSSWRDTRYVWFLIEQENGTVIVIC
jgi:hypothetical protein